MATAIINMPGNSLTGLLPCEGPKIFNFQVDFSSAQQWDFDFTPQWQNKVITSVQTLFIDNSDNASEIEVSINGGQTFKAPADSCGYYTLNMAEPPSVSLVSVGGVVVNVQFMNYYVPPIVWAAP